ncbi:MAG: hypothetical protein GC164_05430 [Phycisphaera sp.]|nr:hypothetical protein [Phycisphaera sp.]
MGRVSELLKMLEPIVRPGQAVGRAPGSSEAASPIETRSFDSLLEEAGMREDLGTDTSVTSQANQPEITHKTVEMLESLNHIENASVRAMAGGSVSNE